MELRRSLDIAQEDFARLVGVSIRTVARWEGEGMRPTPEIREQLDFLLTLRKRLEAVIDRQRIALWLNTPNPEFLNMPPMDLVRSRYGRRVLELAIARAEWGIPG